MSCPNADIHLVVKYDAKWHAERVPCYWAVTLQECLEWIHKQADPKVYNVLQVPHLQEAE